jgi:hypothetical protein
MTLDGFDPRDLEELAAAFERAGEIDPLTAFKEQAARASADPRLAWRQALSEACQAEGVTYHWIVELGFSAFSYPGGTPARVPDDHLAMLQDHDARPAAVAAVIKGACLDPRFRAWPEVDQPD